jgi:hypothetical protein
MRSFALPLVLGVCVLALYAFVVSAPVQAQPLPPRPPVPTETIPPRPTLPPETPTATATAVPTATAAPTVTATVVADPPAPRPRPIAPGRITGTIVDLRTNTPMPGVAVRVGDLVLMSDANGNYDRSGLAPGTYDVVLALPADWGTAAQPLLRVSVAEGETVVQHLAYNGLLP